MELGHSIVAREDIPYPVAILERPDVIPESGDIGYLDIDFRVAAYAGHDVFGFGLLEMNGLPVPFDNGISGGCHCRGEAEDVAIELQGFIDIGESQHGTYAFYSRS